MEKLSEFVDARPGDFFYTGKKEETIVLEAQAILGVVFPPSFSDFLQNFGKLAFRGIEILGISSIANLNKGLPDLVFYNLQLREEGAIPPYLIAFRDEDGQVYHCMDTRHPIGHGEYAIIIWDMVNREVLDTVECSFSEYLNEEVLLAFD